MKRNVGILAILLIISTAGNCYFYSTLNIAQANVETLTAEGETLTAKIDTLNSTFTTKIGALNSTLTSLKQELEGPILGANFTDTYHPAYEYPPGSITDALHVVAGYIINFGSKTAEDVTMTFSWVISPTQEHIEVVSIGSVQGHSKIESNWDIGFYSLWWIFEFEEEGTFSWEITYN